MASTKLNREQVARVLIDATLFGDRTAAKRHHLCERTVIRYRQRLQTDEELSRLVQQKGKASAEGWKLALSRTIKKLLEKVDSLTDQAELVNLPDVIEALKAVGDLQIATEALGVGDEHHREGSPPAEDAGAGEGEEDPAGGEEESGGRES